MFVGKFMAFDKCVACNTSAALAQMSLDGCCCSALRSALWRPGSHAADRQGLSMQRCRSLSDLPMVSSQVYELDPL